MSESIPKAPAPSKAGVIVKYMADKQGAFAAVAGKHLSAERVVKIVGAMLSRNSALAECTPLSILTSVMTAVQMGLDPTGVGGQGYLAPFFRNFKKDGEWHKVREAQFIPGYHGLKEIAYRTGAVDSVQAYPVFKGDHFVVRLGTEQVLEHRPLSLAKGDDDLIATYCVATLKSGHKEFRVVDRVDINKIRERALDKTPQLARAKAAWNTDFVAMAVKSACIRLCKWLPQTPELSLATSLASSAEHADGVDTAMIAAQLGADLKDLGGPQALDEGSTVSKDGEQRPDEDGSQQDDPSPKSRTESVVRRVTKPKPERQVVAVQEPEVEVPDEAPVDDKSPPPPAAKVTAAASKAVDDVYSKLIAEKAMTARFKALTTRFSEVGKFESADKSTDAVFSFLGDLSINVPDIKQDAVWEKVVKIIASPDWRP